MRPADVDSRRSADPDFRQSRLPDAGQQIPRRRRLPEELPRDRVDPDGVQRRGNGLVVGGGMGKRPPGEVEPECGRRPVRPIQRLEHARIVLRFDDDEHVAEVFGGGADHAGSTDVDLLHEVDEGQRGTAGRLGKGVEVHDHQVDAHDAVGGHGRPIVRPVAARQDPAVHLGVKGLDPAVHHLGEPGHLRHVEHGQPGGGERPGGASRGHELPAAPGQFAGEGHESRLVRHAQ